MLVASLAEHFCICVFGTCISFGKCVARISNRMRSLLFPFWDVAQTLAGRTSVTKEVQLPSCSAQPPSPHNSFFSQCHIFFFHRSNYLYLIDVLVYLFIAHRPHKILRLKKHGYSLTVIFFSTPRIMPGI